MTVGELYKEAIIGKHYGLRLVIEFLVYDKKVLNMSDNIDKLTYYLKDRFKNKMNEYLINYEQKLNGQKEDLSCN